MIDERLLERVEWPLSPLRPSIVRTCRPDACTASVRQDSTRSPSSRTVHAPHAPWLQPSLVPVSPIRSRSRSSDDARVIRDRIVGSVDSDRHCRLLFAGRGWMSTPEPQKFNTNFVIFKFRCQQSFSVRRSIRLLTRIEGAQHGRAGLMIAGTRDPL